MDGGLFVHGLVWLRLFVSFDLSHVHFRHKNIKNENVGE